MNMITFAYAYFGKGAIFNEAVFRRTATFSGLVS